MCYNEIKGQSCIACNVKIITTADNFNEETFAEGSCRNTDGGVLVSYFSDGDESSFFFRRDYAEYARNGGQYVRMVFEQGRTTGCEIGNGSMRGAFEVRTNKIETQTDANGHKVFLEYVSGQGETTELKFTVLYK